MGRSTVTAQMPVPRVPPVLALLRTLPVVEEVVLVLHQRVVVILAAVRWTVVLGAAVTSVPVTNPPGKI